MEGGWGGESNGSFKKKAKLRHRLQRETSNQTQLTTRGLRPSVAPTSILPGVLVTKTLQPQHLFLSFSFTCLSRNKHRAVLLQPNLMACVRKTKGRLLISFKHPPLLAPFFLPESSSSGVFSLHSFEQAYIHISLKN